MTLNGRILPPREGGYGSRWVTNRIFIARLAPPSRPRPNGRRGTAVPRPRTSSAREGDPYDPRARHGAARVSGRRAPTAEARAFRLIRVTAADPSGARARP